MEEGLTDEEIYGDGLRPGSQLSGMTEGISQETEETYTSYDNGPILGLEIEETIKAAENALGQIEDFSRRLRRDRDELIGKIRREVEEMYEKKNAAYPSLLKLMNLI